MLHGMTKNIIFDLEATCQEGKRITPQEIIEIGAVAIVDGKKQSTFQTFIQPVAHPKLTDFCTQLTSITQEDVDSAPTYPDAIEDFLLWIGPGSYRLWSWGDFG